MILAWFDHDMDGCISFDEFHDFLQGQANTLGWQALHDPGTSWRQPNGIVDIYLKSPMWIYTFAYTLFSLAGTVFTLLAFATNLESGKKDTWSYENLRQLFFAVHMADVAIRGEQVKKLGTAVWGRMGQLTQLLTLLIAFLYVYMTIGFVFFRGAFDGEGTGCSSLVECMFTFLNYGLREDVGIATVMSPIAWEAGEPTSGYNIAIGRLVYDVSYWLFVTILVLSMLTGIIIDTFGEMRDASNRMEENIQNECFICGISASKFDQGDGLGFAHHVTHAHNKWMYLALWVHILQKPSEDHTGQEAYIFKKLKAGDLSFFPSGRALALPGYIQEG